MDTRDIIAKFIINCLEEKDLIKAISKMFDIDQKEAKSWIADLREGRV